MRSKRWPKMNDPEPLLLDGVYFNYAEMTNNFFTFYFKKETKIKYRLAHLNFFEFVTLLFFIYYCNK